VTHLARASALIEDKERSKKQEEDSNNFSLNSNSIQIKIN
jgi:hypothetical protein